MGSFLGAPKPPPPPPPPAPLPDPADAERKLRLENLERRRRGRAGMIATSNRGLLSEAPVASGPKNLLGE